MDNMRQLWAILSSDLHEHLHATRTLVLSGWRWIFQGISVGEALSSHVLAFLYIPKILPLYIYHSVGCLRTRYLLSRASAFNVPNVHRVV